MPEREKDGEHKAGTVRRENDLSPDTESFRGLKALSVQRHVSQKNISSRSNHNHEFFPTSRGLTRISFGSSEKKMLERANQTAEFLDEDTTLSCANQSRMSIDLTVMHRGPWSSGVVDLRSIPTCLWLCLVESCVWPRTRSCVSSTGWGFLVLFHVAIKTFLIHTITHDCRI